MKKKNNTLNENKEWIVIWNVSLEATKFAYLWPRKKEILIKKLDKT